MNSYIDTDKINVKSVLGEEFDLSINTLYDYKYENVDIAGMSHKPYRRDPLVTNKNININIKNPDYKYEEFENELKELVMKYINPLEYKISKESNVCFDEICKTIINLKTLGMKEEQIEEFYDKYDYKVLCMVESLLKNGHEVEDIMIFIGEDKE